MKNEDNEDFINFIGSNISELVYGTEDPIKTLCSYYFDGSYAVRIVFASDGYLLRYMSYFTKSRYFYITKPYNPTIIEIQNIVDYFNKSCKDFGITIYDMDEFNKLKKKINLLL